MKNSLVNHPKPQGLPSGEFSKSTRFFAFLIAAFLPVPVLTLPLIGLSFYAPLFFLVALEAVLKPPRPWSLLDRKYIVLAIFIWVGIFLSAIVNGFTSGGVNISSYGAITVFRFGYWIFVFVLVIYLVSVGKYASSFVRILGWSILGLAILRWVEVLLYGNFGAWSGTRVLSQNGYGFQFSAFSAFLLANTTSEKGWKRMIAFIGYALLIGAIAVNGSRGSWAGAGAGFIVFLIILLISKPRKFSGMIVFLLLIGGIGLIIFSSSAQISKPIISRFNSIQNLEYEKSYQYRIVMNQKSWRLFQSSPFWGVGAGRFRYAAIELDIPEIFGSATSSKFDGGSAHNSYMSFLAETGLVGTTPYAILILILIFSGFKSAIILARRSQYWGAGIYASFIGMSIHMWVISSITNTGTWFIYALVAAMIILAQETEK
jgi:O-antigen ligase